MHLQMLEGHGSKMAQWHLLHGLMFCSYWTTCQMASVRVRYSGHICLCLRNHQNRGVQAAMQTLESERAALEEQLAAAQVDLSCFSVSHCIITRFDMQI